MLISHLKFALFLSVVLAALQFAQPALLYQRELITAGEWWRLLGGNFVHTNQAHLLLNLGGFWIWTFLCHTATRVPQLALHIALIGLGIGLLLFAFQPQLTWYAGFSGILYGLCVLGGIKLVLQGEMITILIGGALVGLVTLHTVFDLYAGSGSQLSQRLIAAPVILSAHVYGMLIAALLTLPDVYAKLHPKNIKNH